MEKGSDSQKSCCKDEHKLIKADEQNTHTNDYVVKTPVVIPGACIPAPQYLVSGYAPLRLLSATLPNGPPGCSLYDQPVYIRIQHLLI